MRPMVSDRPWQVRSPGTLRQIDNGTRYNILYLRARQLLELDRCTFHDSVREILLLQQRCDRVAHTYTQTSLGFGRARHFVQTIVGLPAECMAICLLRAKSNHKTMPTQAQSCFGRSLVSLTVDLFVFCRTLSTMRQAIPTFAVGLPILEKHSGTTEAMTANCYLSFDSDQS